MAASSRPMYSDIDRSRADSTLASDAGVTFNVTDTEPNRRMVLYGASTIAISMVAGCTSTTSSSEDDNTDGSNEEWENNSSSEGEDANSSERIESPTEVDEYLSNANLYDGSLIDMATEDTIRVSVGAGENGLAFDPPAVCVSPDTKITWAWTGGGGAYNVVSESGGGEHDHDEDEPSSEDEPGGQETLNSGDAEAGPDIRYSETPSEADTILYHCHPHKEVG